MAGTRNLAQVDFIGYGFAWISKGAEVWRFDRRRRVWQHARVTDDMEWFDWRMVTLNLPQEEPTLGPTPVPKKRVQEGKTTSNMKLQQVTTKET